ncbi:MAG TPA: DNA polymerase III subunit epsilon [Xanthomonadaceae bacterium]|jgi:DNA polymerase-3 subunit epsilon|nr:DNA polymerase III subunit epsilon [Xanthomonadaceae bacterium]
MTRQIVLDTETTGLSWEKGNRVVEIGCVELMQRRPTGRHFQRYINPGREMEAGAIEVTGLTTEFLADKPSFAEIAGEFLEFIDGAELVIHNAAFDIGFLDYELGLLDAGLARMGERCSVLDTLEFARQRYPGQRNSLDALCKRLGVDNAQRTLHGALLDAQLLSEAYLHMTAGQGDLGFDTVSASSGPVQMQAVAVHARRVQRADPGEDALHRERLSRIDSASGGHGLWPKDATA